MRAWIENDDDITPYIEIDVYDADGNMIEATGFPCKPLPWRIEFDTEEIQDGIVTDWIDEDE